MAVSKKSIHEATTIVHTRTFRESKMIARQTVVSTVGRMTVPAAAMSVDRSKLLRSTGV